MRRIQTIDFARGLVMIIMALDHTRGLLHADAMTQDPTDLATTSPILFFTRWITHLCAPAFVFLSGTSAYLSLKNSQDIRAGRRFLRNRGLWLLLLECTIVNFALWMDLRFRIFLFEVIATIGSGFIILSLLSKLSAKTLGIIGLAIIFLHDLLSEIMIPLNPALKFITSLFLGPGAFPITPHLMLVIAYPILPWLGIMLAGYAGGKFFELPTADRQKLFLRIGLAALALFILVRGINIYGDPSRWTVQKNGTLTFLSFMKVSKYPPSLLFTLVTLGILFLILSAAERKNLPEFVLVYGRTPLFYFLVHLYIIHLILFAMVFLQGFHASELVFGPFKFGRPARGSGLTLPAIYLVWIGVVALMYPLCKWYGNYKARHRENKWLKYL